MRVLLAVVLVVAVGVSAAAGPGAGAGQPRLLHPGYRQRLVRLRRHHGRAAAQDPAARLEHRRQAARRRRRQPAAGGQERDAARPVLHGDQSLGPRGQGGLHREAREHPRPRRRVRHLLSRRHGHARSSGSPRCARSATRSCRSASTPSRSARSASSPGASCCGRPASATAEIKGFGGSTQHVGYNVIIDAFKDGRADILFAVVTPKHPSVSEIVSSVDVEFLGLDADTAKALLPLGYVGGHHAARHLQEPVEAGEHGGLPDGADHQQGAAGGDRLHGDEDGRGEQGRARARPRRAGRVRSADARGSPTRSAFPCIRAPSGRTARRGG